MIQPIEEILVPTFTLRPGEETRQEIWNSPEIVELRKKLLKASQDEGDALWQKEVDDYCKDHQTS